MTHHAGESQGVFAVLTQRKAGVRLGLLPVAAQQPQTRQRRSRRRPLARRPRLKLLRISASSGSAASSRPKTSEKNRANIFVQAVLRPTG